MKQSYLFGGITLFLWSTTATVTKMLLGSLDSIQIMNVCSLFAAVFLFFLNLIKGNLKLLKTYTLSDYLQMAGLGTLGMFLYNIFLYNGIDSMMASQAFIINYLWPIMTVVFACLILKERLTRRKAVAIVLSFLGVVIVTTNGKLTGIAGEQLIGALCCILAAVSYGAFSVLNKRKHYNNFVSMMVYYSVSFVLSTLYNLWNHSIYIPQIAQLPGLLWLGICTSAIAYTFWALALEKGDTAKLSNLAYITPFLSLVWTSLLLHEPVTIYSLIGLFVIVSGILLQMREKAPQN